MGPGEFGRPAACPDTAVPVITAHTAPTPTSLPVGAGAPPASGADSAPAPDSDTSSTSSPLPAPLDDGDGQAITMDQLNQPIVIKSLCECCRRTGRTTLMQMDIPFFRAIIIMAFQCRACGYRNNTVRSLEDIAPRGVRYALRVAVPDDLDRTVVKGERATITIPCVGLEIPPQAQRGAYTTVEGVVARTISALAGSQPLRRTSSPEEAAQVDAFIRKLRALTARLTATTANPEAHGPQDDTESGFDFVLDDPCGLSFVSSPFWPAPDPRITVTRYTRSAELDASIGIQPATTDGEDDGEAAGAAGTATAADPAGTAEPAGSASVPQPPPTLHGDTTTAAAHALQHELAARLDPKHHVFEQDAQCYLCSSMGNMRFMMLDIPYFREVVIMAFSCDACGYRSSEVKCGGAVSTQGRILRLVVRDPAEDLNRSVLKSETAVVQVPEIGLSVGRGTLGGRFTTLEGLLNDFHDQLAAANPFIGDSATSDMRARRAAFMAKLDALRTGALSPFTVIIHDPLAHSYIQNPWAPDPDPDLTTELFTRSPQEDEELGLTDICTDPRDYLSPEAYDAYAAAHPEDAALTQGDHGAVPEGAQPPDTAPPAGPTDPTP